MNDRKKNNLNKESKSFLSFPKFLNNGTILIIMATYIVLLLAVIIMIVPKYNYTSIPDYSHTMINKDISGYFKLTSAVTPNSKGDISQSQTLTVYIDKNNIDELNEGKGIKVNYEISGLTNKNTMDYMYSGSRSTYSELPVQHTLISNSSVDGGNYKKIFGKIIYEITNEDGTQEQKEYKFSESILTLSKKELKSATNEKKVIKDVVSVSANAIKSTEADFYETTTNVNINVQTKLYHLDYQSWIVTEKGKVYPLTGFYNVSYSEKPTLTAMNKISTNLNAEYIVLKVVVTNSYGYTQTLLYKEKFENIVVE